MKEFKMVAKYWDWDEDEYVLTMAKPCNVWVGEYFSTDITEYVTCYSCGHISVETEETCNTVVVFADGSHKVYCNKYEYCQSIDLWDYRKIFPKAILKKMPPKDNLVGTRYINEECVCPGCKDLCRHKDDRIIHGLSAFNQVYNMQELWVRLNHVLYSTDTEICCTSKAYCGPIGITGHGDITAYFHTDVWSYLDDYGNRVLSERGMKNLENPYSDHDEYWVKNIIVEEIWVKEWYWDSLTQEEKNMIVFMTTHSGLDSITIIPNKHCKEVIA